MADSARPVVHAHELFQATLKHRVTTNSHFLLVIHSGVIYSKAALRVQVRGVWAACTHECSALAISRCYILYTPLQRQKNQLGAFCFPTSQLV